MWHSVLIEKGEMLGNLIFEKFDQVWASIVPDTASFEDASSTLSYMLVYHVLDRKPPTERKRFTTADDRHFAEAAKSAQEGILRLLRSIEPEDRISKSSLREIYPRFQALARDVRFLFRKSGIRAYQDFFQLLHIYMSSSDSLFVLDGVEVAPKPTEMVVRLDQRTPSSVVLTYRDTDGRNMHERVTFQKIKKQTLAKIVFDNTYPFKITHFLRSGPITMFGPAETSIRFDSFHWYESLAQIAKFASPAFKARFLKGRIAVRTEVEVLEMEGLSEGTDIVSLI